MLFLLILLLLLFNKEIVSNSIYESLDLFIKIIFPSMFFPLLMSSYIVKTNKIENIGRFFHPITHFIIKSPDYLSSGIFIFSLILGCPSNIKLIIDLLNKGDISKKNANLYLLYTSNPSLSLIFALLSDNHYFYLYLFIPILSSIIIGLISNKYLTNNSYSKQNIFNFNREIIHIFDLLLLILSITIISGIIYTFLRIFTNTEALVLIEITKGLLITNNDYIIILLLSSLGLSINLQAIGIIKSDLPLKYFLLGRIANIIIYYLLYFPLAALFYS